MNMEPGEAIVCFKSPASVCFRDSSFHHSRGLAGMGGDKDRCTRRREGRGGKGGGMEIVMDGDLFEIILGFRKI